VKIAARSRKILIALLCLAFNYLLLEAASALCLRRLEHPYRREADVFPIETLSPHQRDLLARVVRTTRPPENRLDADLGWTLVESSTQAPSDSHGIRSPHEVALDPPPGRVRVAALGDSFTYGIDVAEPDTWEARLNRLDPRLEVLNFGVGAYGLDQAYLRYPAAARFHPDVVLIGFMTENIFRDVNVFRPFYVPRNGTPLAKPRFLLKDDDLVLLPNPLPDAAAYQHLLDDDRAVLRQLGANDHFYQRRERGITRFHVLPSVRVARILRYLWFPPDSANEILRRGQYNPTSEAFRITTRIFEKFSADAARHRSVPLIVIFPEQEDLRRALDGRPKRHQPLLDYLDAHHLAYVDLVDELAPRVARDRITEILPAHFSPAGHEMIAEILREKLRPLIAKR